MHSPNPVSTARGCKIMIGQSASLNDHSTPDWQPSCKDRGVRENVSQKEVMWARPKIYLKKKKNFFFWLHCLACKILGSPPGVKPEPSALEAWGLNSWIIREILDHSFNNHVRRIMLIDISSSRYLFNACVPCPPVLLGCNFLPKSKHLFISWLQSLSTVIGFPFLQTLSAAFIT